MFPNWNLEALIQYEIEIGCDQRLNQMKSAVQAILVCIRLKECIKLQNFNIHIIDVWVKLEIFIYSEINWWIKEALEDCSILCGIKGIHNVYVSSYCNHGVLPRNLSSWMVVGMQAI